MEILYFSTSRCPPCKYIRRCCISELLRKLPKAEIREIDAAEKLSLARRMNVSAVPITIIIRGGKDIARRIGSFDVAALALEVSPRKRRGKPGRADTED